MLISVSKKYTIVLALLTCAACVTEGDTKPRNKGNRTDAAQYNYQLGAHYLRNGNYKLARARLEGALEQDPNMAEAHSTLGLLYERLQSPEVAGKHYASAVRLAPDDANIQNIYAVFLCRNNRYAEAEKHFLNAIKVPEYSTPEAALTNAGVCILQKPDRAKAEKYFRRALKRKDSYGEALIQMSSLMHQTDRSLQARAFLQRYLAKNEATADELYLGVEIERNLGDDRAMQGYAKQLLRDHPGSSATKRLLESGYNAG